MTFDYNKESKTPMSLVLENSITAEGQFVDLRIAVETLPKGKQWHHIRHCDDDGSEPASLKRGCVAVNFFGTFVRDPIAGMKDGDELEITEWGFDE